MTKWEGERNESLYERCGMETHANRVECGVMEWVKKKNTLRWFGHTEWMKTEEYVMKGYVNETVGPNSRGRLLGGWKDKLKEYVCERGATRKGGFEQGRRECLDSEQWRIFCHGHPLGGYSQRE